MMKRNQKQTQLDAISKEDDLFDFKIKPIKPKIKNNEVHNNNNNNKCKKVQKPKAAKFSNNWWKAEPQQFDCDDSLKDMKNGKIKNLNDKIELLKLELKSVLESSNPADDETLKSNSFTDLSADVLQTISPIKSSSAWKPSAQCKSEFHHEIKGSNTKYKATLANSTPLKDLNYPQVIKRNELSSSPLSYIALSENDSFSSVSSSSFKNCDLSKKSVPSTSKEANPKYDMSKLSQCKVEKLLFKSFLLQNLYQKFSSDESSSEAVANGKKKRKFFPKKRNRPNNEKRNLNAIPISRKRNKTTKKFSRKKLRVVDKVQNSIADFVDDLCIENLNFNEPFYLSSSDEDLEIVKNCDKSISVICIDEQESLRQSCIIGSSREHQTSKTLCGDNGREKKSCNLSSSEIWECPICFEPSRGQEIITTSCGHIFCQECIHRHYSKSGKTCPTCRGNLDDKKLIPLCDLD